MRCHRNAILTFLLLTSAACSARPMETAMPRPAEVLLRVDGRRGTLMFVDADSLVMFDMRATERVTVRPGEGVLLELYRGQRGSGAAIAKGVGKGALVGAAVGAGEGLLTVALAKLLGHFWGKVDVGDAMSTGAIIGVATGVVSGGKQAAKEGEPVWERVTLLQLRQEVCRCANPEPSRVEPAVRLIPWG